MPAHRHCVVSATLTQVGETETGVWCPRCVLPSAVAATFVVEAGGRPAGVIRGTACVDCGACLDAGQP